MIFYLILRNNKEPVQVEFSKKDVEDKKELFRKIRTGELPWEEKINIKGIGWVVYYSWYSGNLICFTKYAHYKCGRCGEDHHVRWEIVYDKVKLYYWDCYKNWIKQEFGTLNNWNMIIYES